MEYYLLLLVRASSGSGASRIKNITDGRMGSYKSCNFSYFRLAGAAKTGKENERVKRTHTQTWNESLLGLSGRDLRIRTL